jgi:hypothetical protein
MNHKTNIRQLFQKTSQRINSYLFSAAVTIILGIVLTAFSLYSLPQGSSINSAFDRGEKLTYKVYYDAILTGKVIAGEAVFSINNDNKVYDDQETYHIEAVGKTKGAFNLFYKVIDRYESYVAEKDLLPRLFVRRVDEGGYTIKQNVFFQPSLNSASFKDLKNNRTSTVTIPDNTHDVLSVIYYARTLDYSKAKKGDMYSFNFLIDDTVYSSSIEIMGRKTITTSIGDVKCIHMRPRVITGSVFKDEYPMNLYVSDDENKIPVLMSTGVIVGTVKMELVKFSGLRNSFTALVQD